MTKKSATLDLTESTMSPILSHDWLISAMTNLSACIIKHQEADLRFKEEKSENWLKAWKKLPGIQQNILLLGRWKKTALFQKSPVKKFY